jgi:hypothetical protein
MIKWMWLITAFVLVNIVIPSIACWLMSMASWPALFGGIVLLLVLASVDIAIVRAAWKPLLNFTEETIDSFTQKGK